MIRLVAVLTCCVLLVAVADCGAQAPPVKIGVLLPYTGPLSVQGNDATRGLELYLKQSGGRAGGRQLQVFKEDTEAKPDVGLTKVV
jgi:branched-chain amino acid transport system substrate-binding protein